MKNRIHPVFFIFILALFGILFLTQCDLIIGSGDRTGNVGIDLSGFYEDGRAISMPTGATMTFIRVSVFGPGMEPIEKYVSAGTRYINMYVPAGQHRFFTLEIFFTADGSFTSPHLLSYKGRTEEDLRPGYFMGLKFRMTAGASRLLAPDYGTNRVWQGGGISLGSLTSGNLAYTGTFQPADIDLDSDGWIYAANWFDGTGIVYGSEISGKNGRGSNGTGQQMYALAIDRDADFNIDMDTSTDLDYSILYASNLSTGTYTTTSFFYIILDHIHDAVPSFVTHNLRLIDPAGTITVIRGMAIDPWTHNLYIVGILDGDQALIRYDPLYVDNPTKPAIRGRIISFIKDPDRFSTLNDVIVKDEGVFILNEAPKDKTNLPAVIKYDRLLNYQGEFGHISTDGKVFVASTAPGDFYWPKRFIAQENDGLYIVDDSDRLDSTGTDTFDKIVYINTELDPASWHTFPLVQPDIEGVSNEPFRFFH